MSEQVGGLTAKALMASAANVRMAVFMLPVRTVVSEKCQCKMLPAVTARM
jgi:hypothetical protein